MSELEQELLLALEGVLNTSGARGRYHSLDYALAVEKAEQAISKATNPQHKAKA